MNKLELIKAIDNKINSIHHLDAKGILKWNEFKEFVNDFKDKTSKKTLEERKTDFKGKLTPFLEKYGRNLLNDFYGYWVEHGDNDKKMRFEKQTSFSISRRLSTWNKKSNDDSGDEKFKAEYKEYNR